jgi:hypothetical protein
MAPFKPPVLRDTVAVNLDEALQIELPRPESCPAHENTLLTNTILDVFRDETEGVVEAQELSAELSLVSIDHMVVTRSKLVSSLLSSLLTHHLRVATMTLWRRLLLSIASCYQTIQHHTIEAMLIALMWEDLGSHLTKAR